jgi:hypothetical protein
VSKDLLKALATHSLVILAPGFIRGTVDIYKQFTSVTALRSRMGHSRLPVFDDRIPDCFTYGLSYE